MHLGTRPEEPVARGLALIDVDPVVGLRLGPEHDPDPAITFEEWFFFGVLALFALNSILLTLTTVVETAPQSDVRRRVSAERVANDMRKPTVTVA